MADLSTSQQRIPPGFLADFISNAKLSLHTGLEHGAHHGTANGLSLCWHGLTNSPFQGALLLASHGPLGVPATEATAALGIPGDDAVPGCLLELFNHSLII